MVSASCFFFDSFYYEQKDGDGGRDRRSKRGSSRKRDGDEGGDTDDSFLEFDSVPKAFRSSRLEEFNVCRRSCMIEAKASAFSLL